jgi:hypothetical protein
MLQKAAANGGSRRAKGDKNARKTKNKKSRRDNDSPRAPGIRSLIAGKLLQRGTAQEAQIRGHQGQHTGRYET